MQWHPVAKGTQYNNVTKSIYLELSLQTLRGGRGSQMDRSMKGKIQQGGDRIWERFTSEGGVTYL